MWQACILQCSYSSPGWPTVGNEMAGKILCVHGPPTDASVSSIYFMPIADMVQWMLTSHHGVDLLRHYTPLPDFLVSSDAAGNLGYGAIFNNQ